MATNISYDGSNSGLQIGQNNGPITAQFLQSEASLNQACLRDLRTTSPHDDKDRIERTNGGLLIDSYRWILDNDQFKQWQDNQSSRLLWIKGDPGKGKTMLLCGIINELTLSIGDNINISFFFCQATDIRINNATAVLRGLIYSLVEKQPSLLSHVRSRYDKAGKTLFEDANAWDALSNIFTDILKDPALRKSYLVIDALDECTTDLPLLLDLVIYGSSTHPHVNWIVSSRNWPNIEERLNTAGQITPVSLELNEASVSDAVRKFIQHKVHQLAKVKKYNDEICHTLHRHLLSNSQGTFLWVALVCQDLYGTLLMHVLKKIKAFPPGLNALYGRMFDQIRRSEDVELCKRILAVMCVVYRPITLDELTTLLEIPDDLPSSYEALSQIILICGSFLTVRENVIVFVHQSAREFLLETARTEMFQRDEEAEHLAIFSRSVRTMFKLLRRNILDIKLIGTSTEEFTQQCPNPLAAARYACLYWVDHLQEGWCSEDNSRSLEDGGCLDQFLRQKYIHWLEAIGILGSVPQCITAMLKLEDLLQKKGKSQALLERARDASRFIRYCTQAIENSPLQVYSSGLIFSPAQSITRKCFWKEKSDWILNIPAVEESWSSCLQTLEGHSDSVWSVAWSPDGRRLASASDDRTIRIWDAATGQCTSILERHIFSVTSIAWSPDGSRLASASDDNDVRVWDAATSQCLSTFKGRIGPINSIAWSTEGSRLASATGDGIVRIWDVATGQCALILKGHSESVWSIAWSPDGNRITSASNDRTVRIWDAATGQCTFVLEGHKYSVNFIGWSPDGSGLASASDDNTVRVWNAASGQCVSTLEGHCRSVTSISWSPDGSRLASASDDGAVRIWDTATGQCASTLEARNGPVTTIAWSPGGSRLASASGGGNVTIWDAANLQFASTLLGHSDSVWLISWSPDGNRLASASGDNTVRIWNPANGQSASALDGHRYSVTSLSWSPDGSRLASASGDKTLRIWDPVTGQCVFMLDRHMYSITSIAWSPDGSRLTLGSAVGTIRILDATTGQCTSILERHRYSVTSIAWSPDGSRLASASDDSTIRVWDATTSRCTSILEGHSYSVSSIAWSPDGRQIASASNDRTTRVWNPVTGQCTSILEGHRSSVTSIAWSADGSRIASASKDRTIRIWDASTSQCVMTIDIHSSHFLQFDRCTPSYLHTNVGTFNLTSIDPIASKLHRLALPGTFGYGLSDGSSWITYNGINVLWLPAEYRPSNPSLFVKSATAVAIGCSSGRVIFLELSEHNSPSRI